eukprot:GFUD01028562.1.p1 GENE.GFUD01028562.1~~GFUD01028562.1.p1  ORF type:complete len:758 (+),score=208.87 GFUD01028562.1:1221-3494(+)
MASLFEYEKEAIRIKAKRVDKGKDEYRKFSVDPNITSFEVLQSILCRAFELPPSDISIAYRHVDKGGQETWNSLLSDWDLDTAILGSADHDLFLQVAVMEPGSLGEVSMGEAIGDGIKSPVLEAGQTLAKELEPVQKSIQNAAANARAAGASQVNQAGAGLQGLVNKSSNQATGFFKRHYQNTLPGLTSKFRAALNLDIEERNVEPCRPPVSDVEFRSFLNKVGQVVAPREFRLAVYRGGLEPGLRKIAWKHLLNVYPAGMTGGERLKYLKEMSQLYFELKSDWMNLVLQGRVSDDVKTVMNMVRKDVLRTDRANPFFAGEGNPNVTTLFNILTTYALNHPTVSYCQGMSDLASPLLVTISDEAHAYVCFTALMRRMKPNFLLDGVAMTTKFQHLSEGLMYYDPEFYTYLKLHSADDLLFCYRWLLLEMKREFAFENALKALEVSWSSLPPATADTKVELWETRFSPVMSPSTLELAKPCETPYGKVRALRKQTLDRTKSSDSDVRGRIKSETAVSKRRHSIKQFEKSQSLANVNNRRKALGSSTNASIEEESNGNTPNNATKDGSPEKTPILGKKLTNLKEFYALTGEKVPNVQKPEENKSPKTMAENPKGISSPQCNSEVLNKKEEAGPSSNVTSPCVEAAPDSPDGDDPFDWVGYSQAGTSLTVYCNRLPPPPQFGHGNPFLMFLCLACLLEHREHIMRSQLDYQDIAMYFDKLVRAHDVDRVLGHARRLFAEYLNEDWTPSPQPATNGQLHHC